MTKKQQEELQEWLVLRKQILAAAKSSAVGGYIDPPTEWQTAITLGDFVKVIERCGVCVIRASTAFNHVLAVETLGGYGISRNGHCWAASPQINKKGGVLI